MATKTYRKHLLQQRSPGFLALETSFVEDKFSHRLGGDGFRWIQAHYVYHALSFHHSYISSTSDHQASDPGGWGPLSWKLPVRKGGGQSLLPWGEPPDGQERTPLS